MFLHKLAGTAVAALCLIAAPAAFAQDAKSDIRILTRELGPGTLPDTINPEDITNFEKGVRSGMAEGITVNGITVEADKVIISTEIVTMGGRQILLSRIDARPALFYYQYSGAVGGKLTITVCATSDATPFTPQGTKCEAEARRVFAKK